MNGVQIYLNFELRTTDRQAEASEYKNLAKIPRRIVSESFAQCNSDLFRLMFINPVDLDCFN